MVDTASDGIDLFSLPDHEHICRLSVDAHVHRYPLQAAVGEQGTVVVTGSEYGRIHVFRIIDGQEICCLRHNTRGLVHCVTVGISNARLSNLFHALC